jgi:sulfopyruvate decarboxylase TPP-binding subunit
MAMDPGLAERIVRGLREAGIEFVSYLPESRLSQILPLLRDDAAVRLVPVCSEAEAVTIASGAVLGGVPAACYMECTGLYVSAYPLVVVAKQIGVPLLLVVGFLGGFDDQRNSFLYATIGKHVLSCLDGLDIPYRVLEDGQDLETRIMNAQRTAIARRGPVALIFSGEFTV